MGEPIDLATARALKSDDNRAWTPAQALRHTADEIEKGSIVADRVLIVCSGKRDPKGEVRFQTYVKANMSGEQAVAAAAYALRDMPELE